MKDCIDCIISFKKYSFDFIKKKFILKILYLMILVGVYISCDYYHHVKCGGINAIIMMFNPVCSWLLWIMSQMSYLYSASIFGGILYLIVELKQFGNQIGVFEKKINDEKVEKPKIFNPRQQHEEFNNKRL